MPFWSRVRNYVSHLLGHPAPASVSTEEVAPVPSTGWDHFRDLLEQIEVARDQEVQNHNGQSDPHRAAALQDEQERIRSYQQRMLADILGMHQRLDTGLGEDELRAFAQSLKEHCHQFLAYRDEHLTHLVMFAIQRRFHEEARQRAFRELTERMARARVEWPPPTGLSPSADEAERAAARERQLSQERQDFLTAKLMRFADLMLGVVPVWRAAYPEPGGSVWQSTVLRAVGAALTFRHNDEILQKAQEHQEEWEKLLAQELSQQLARIREHLAGGVDSIATARALTDEAGRVCQETAPELVWSFLQGLP